MLTADVVHLSDGGPDHRAARRPVRGPQQVARLFVNLTRKRLLPSDEFHRVTVNGQPGSYLVRDGEPFMLTVLGWRGSQVAEAISIVNPDKLRGFHAAWSKH
jgi:RNA polymerase sigma-70 factor (ECF subfamily)